MKCLLLLALLSAPGLCSARASEDSLRFGRFGRVMVYRSSPTPRHVVLYLSGDGGWNLGVVYMARELTTLDAMVVGVDIRTYLAALEKSSDPCSYPAGDLEALGQYVQKKYGYADYVKPVLIGYSSGATLIYATLVQAPATTFRGAVSLGFCPDLPITKPLCEGSGLRWTDGPHGKGVSFLAAPGLEPRWIAFQGLQDQVCDPVAVRRFVAQIPRAEIVLLPKVGHGFSNPRNWMPQFRQSFGMLVQAPDATEPPAASATSLSDLPIVEVPARGKPRGVMAVHLTGDGGFGVTDKGIATTLAESGIPVVVLNSLRYFWKARTPEGAAADLARILRHYLAAWNADKFVLIGYSFGADVSPYLLNRLPPDLRARLQSIALLGLDRTAEFQFHLSDWIGSGAAETPYPVLPELERLRGTPILCFYGERDKDTIAPAFDPSLAKVYALPSGHRFGSHFAFVTDRILAQVP